MDPIKSSATGLNTTEMLKPLLKVPSMRTKGGRAVYPTAFLTINPGDGPVSRCRIHASNARSPHAAKHGYDYHDAGIRL